LVGVIKVWQVDVDMRLSGQRHEMPPKQIPAITALTTIIITTTNNNESTTKWQ